LDNDEFRRWSLRAAGWGADYRAGLQDMPVRARSMPGEIAAQIPPAPPETAEPMDVVFADFERIILPGMTHWQHPGFFAYFPANAAPPSVVAEYLVTAMAAQCMLWQTSPAATELETAMLGWLRQALDLPEGFVGVIQDSASSATLAAVLTMRERALGWRGNAAGLSAHAPVRIYCSDQVHSSIDRAIWVAGIGEANLVRVPVEGPTHSMSAQALDAAILRDRDAGMLPAGIIASVGGTSIGGTDDIEAVCAVARRHGLYVHVDAAWAGSAMICAEFRHLWRGIEEADSIVFNPHKWLGAQFDCSAHFLKSPEDLVRTLAIQPEFLKTHGRDGIINYSEWSVPLGRRFRALKLWFLMRAYGLETLRQMIRNHVEWARELADLLRNDEDFEIVTEPFLSLFTFRHKRAEGADLDAHSLAVVQASNDDGRIYLTQTKVNGRIAIRFQVGSFETTREHVVKAHAVIRDCAARIG
jgi:aromatic-L-amino-acid/L-tryptophan decarboxylase